MNKKSKYLLQNKWHKKPDNYYENNNQFNQLIKSKNIEEESNKNVILEDESDDVKFSKLWPMELNKHFI